MKLVNFLKVKSSFMHLIDIKVYAKYYSQNCKQQTQGFCSQEVLEHCVRTVKRERQKLSYFCHALEFRCYRCGVQY